MLFVFKEHRTFFEKVTRQQVMDDFNMPEWELDKQIAVLRHCELVKGKKEADGVYLVLFD